MSRASWPTLGDGWPMASVVVTDPKILILDEPTNQLDLRNRRRVAAAIDELPEDTVVITHDLALEPYGG